MTSKVWILSVFGGPPRLFQDDAGTAAVSPDGSQIALIRGDAKEHLVDESQWRRLPSHLECPYGRLPH